MTSAAAGTSGLTPEQISAIDAAHLWHPYSTIGAETVPPVVAVGARGASLTLIHDGEPIIESSLILYYIDEVFPQPPLMPNEPCSTS